MKFKSFVTVILVLASIIAFGMYLCMKCRTNGCFKLANKAWSYCEEHTCEKEGCYYDKAPKSRYCYLHTCDWDGCYELNLYTESRGRIEYCRMHQEEYEEEQKRCKLSECMEKRYPGGSYCKNHTCYYYSCRSLNRFKDTSISENERKYCEDHGSPEARARYLETHETKKKTTSTYSGTKHSGSSKKKSSTKKSSARKSYDGYDDPEDYADDYADEYDSWDDAYDDWYDNAD